MSAATLVCVLFWSLALVPCTAFVLYPVVTALGSRKRRRPVRAQVGGDCPRVTVIVAAYNEQEVIGRRLENLLEQDYPPERLKILVATDGSTDATDAIVSSFDSQRVRLVRSEANCGKMAALNQALKLAANAEVLVFTDANTVFLPDAVRSLARWFALHEIGCVSGVLEYCEAGDGLDEKATLRGERAYWRWDTRLKLAESGCGTMVGAAGAIFALRPCLAVALPPEQANDMIWPIWACYNGYASICDPQAIAIEPTGGSAVAEYRRRVRIIAQGLQGVFFALEFLRTRARQGRRQLSLGERGVLAARLVAKKLCRYLAFPALILMILVGTLAQPGITLQTTRLLVLVGGFVALLGGVQFCVQRPLKPLPDVRYAAAMGAAAITGFVQFLKGRHYATWSSEREVGAERQK